MDRKRKRTMEESVEMMDTKKYADVDSPIFQQFQVFQQELDSRYDKYERIVKCSRDITIQSKRVIFLLHRGGCDESSRTNVLQEAVEKFSSIKETFKKVAVELQNQDCYQFLKAYSPGLQEFIEAYSFWYYIKYKQLVSYEETCNQLDFQYSCDTDMTNNPPAEKTNSSIPPEQTNIPDLSNPSDQCLELSNEKAKLQPIRVPIPPAQYILGISDLTGELMRLAINSVGHGNLAVPMEICNMMRIVYDEFVLFGSRQQGLHKKLEVLKNSLKKVENTCYTIHIRGSEIPKKMLASLVATNTNSDHKLSETTN